MKNDLRTAIDTGVAISAALLPHAVPRQAVGTAAARGRQLVSEATVDELNEVLRRPKFDRYLPAARRLEFLTALVREAEVVDITDTVAECRDSEDNKFLELALSGKASHIIGGDSDLLVLHPFRGIAIVNPQSFVMTFDGKSPRARIA